ncbi:MAG: nucleotidyltransferase domain-containing protein, partial [Chloroflexota bacterium]
MATTPDLKEVSRILKQLLPAQYGAVLFGSRATGRARPGSDWDIGLIGPEPLGGAVIETIREELDELPTLHSFDVVDLRTVPDTFRQKALRGAKAVLSAAALKEFEKEMNMPADGEVNLTAFEATLG